MDSDEYNLHLRVLEQSEAARGDGNDNEGGWFQKHEIPCAKCSKLQKKKNLGLNEMIPKCGMR